jgi:hypothetical protein
MRTKGQFVISCHADTGFRSHRCARERGGRVFHGHLDNFAGVRAVLDAYFSGRMDAEGVRIELTHGEETDFAGALAVRRTLSPDDTVVVVDVTGARTRADITVEKCGDPETRRFVAGALSGMDVAIFDGCPDPVSDSDETDVYRGACRRVFFLGIPCTGGDYNAGRVRCRAAGIVAASLALIRLAKRHASGRLRPGNATGAGRRSSSAAGGGPVAETERRPRKRRGRPASRPRGDRVR